MLKRVATVLLLCAACGGDEVVDTEAEQAALEAGHGEWAITIRAEVSGIVAPEFTIHTCVDFDNPAPGFELTPEGIDCDGRAALRKETLTWTQDCRFDDKHWDTSGSLLYSGDTFTGTLSTKENGKPLSTANIAGTRVGDC